MDMPACIKKLYPDIKKNEFLCQNDSDGRGDYIKRWDYAQPQPTQVELDAVYPQILREQKIATLKSVCKKIAYKNHDIDDKIEALAGLKTVQEILEIKNWIKAVKYVFGQVKTQINNAIDVTSIEAISVGYDAVLGQVEAYKLTL